MIQSIAIFFICCIVVAYIPNITNYLRYKFCEAKKEIRPTKLYLAGPITGVSNAKAKFELAKNNLERYGFIVVTPFENGLSDKATYEQHMAADFKLIDKCDSIALMPGWSGSVGCMMELQYCYKKNKLVVYPLCFTGNYYTLMAVTPMDHMLSKLFASEANHDFVMVREMHPHWGVFELLYPYITMLKKRPKYADLQ